MARQTPRSSFSFVTFASLTVIFLKITFRKVKLAEQSYCLHDKIIKCIDTHPLNNNLFLTSSTDG